MKSQTNTKPPLMIIPIGIGSRLAKPILGLSFSLKKNFPELKQQLSSSELPFEEHEYIAISIVNIAFFFLLFFFLLFVLMFKVQEKELLYSFGQALMYSSLIGALMSYALFTYPNILAGKKAEETDKNLVFALRDLLMQVSSGVPLYNALVNVSKSGYGQISMEFETVAKSINIGMPVDKSFQNMAIHTKSTYLKRVTWQLVNTIKAGSSIKSALKIIVSDLTQDQKSKIRDYAHELNLWSLIYMLFAVAVPTIGIVMMVILSSFMGMGMGKPMFIAFILTCFVIQYVIISLIKSRRPMVEF